MKFFNLTTSRTKQFCETSSKNGKLSADLTALCHFVLHFFPSHVSKVLRLPRKSDAKSYEVLHLSRKIISANLKIWCSKMQPLSGNQRLDLLTCLLEMSLVLPATRNAPLQILFKHLQTSHASSFFETVLYKTYRFVHFWQGAERIAPGKTMRCPKMVRTWRVFTMLPSKCALRHNGVHFFILFQHPNFQKCSEHAMWCF